MISKKFLKEQVEKRKIVNPNNFSSANENLKLFKSKGDKYDLFISHSFRDKDLILELRYMFNIAGYSVYIDWIDDVDLDRSNVNEDTAKLIRDRIMQCKGLSYIATSNVGTSKWCPWELGIADGLLNQRSCILPIVEDSEFNGQEYLGLYPYIDYRKISKTNTYEFWVFDSKNNKKYSTLMNWLNGKDLIEH